MNDCQDDKYLHAFNLIQGIGPSTLRNIYDHFLSFESAWLAKSWDEINLNQNIIAKIRKEKQKIDPEKEWERMKENNIQAVSFLNKSFPELLKHIYNPPAIIYVRGSLNPDAFNFAVVGTRKFSKYGEQTASRLAGDLAKSGLTIVSGLANGIDTFAHRAALDSNAQTIAVLGTPINKIYPRQNQELAERISQQGALVSEYPLDTKTIPQHFAQRNRIIAGMSMGVLVVEAPIKSGALITAGNALDENRDVFATPGQISSENSQGPHYLIQNGAKLVSKAQDILEELVLTKKTKTN